MYIFTYKCSGTVHSQLGPSTLSPSPSAAISQHSEGGQVRSISPPPAGKSPSSPSTRAAPASLGRKSPPF